MFQALKTFLRNLLSRFHRQVPTVEVPSVPPVIVPVPDIPPPVAAPAPQAPAPVGPSVVPPVAVDSQPPVVVVAPAYPPLRAFDKDNNPPRDAWMEEIKDGAAWQYYVSTYGAFPLHRPDFVPAPAEPPVATTGNQMNVGTVIVDANPHGTAAPAPTGTPDIRTQMLIAERTAALAQGVAAWNQLPDSAARAGYLANNPQFTRDAKLAQLISNTDINGLLAGGGGEGGSYPTDHIAHLDMANAHPLWP